MGWEPLINKNTMIDTNLYREIEETTGKYDKAKRFFVNNWTDEDFTGSWATATPDDPSSGVYTIKAGETGGPYPQHVAYHLTTHLVNREMQKAGKTGVIGNRFERAPFEEKTLQAIADGETVEHAIREQERAKIIAEMESQPIAEGGITTSETRRKTRGRPKKVVEFEGANTD